MPLRLSRPSLAAAVCGVALAFAASRPAGATGDATAELGLGGSVAGDISSIAGELDRIGIDLVVGEPVKLKLKAHFPATLALVDPDGAPVTIGFTDGMRSFTSSEWTAPATGRFEFRVGSFDGTQGDYKLKATPAWQKTISVGPFGRAEIDVPMPAGSRIAATFKGTGLVLNQFRTPSGEVLMSGVQGGPRSLKVPATNCPLPGTYELDVTADPSFKGVVTRTLPKFRATSATIRNGIAAVSFVQDGVAQLFKKECQSCHTWAASFNGVRSFAADSLRRIRSGNMPETGPGLTPAEIDLVANWIKTGKQQ